MRYSTGRPGREKAPAVAEPPTTPMRAGSTAAASATTVSRRTHAPRILPTNFMLDLSHLSYAARGTCPTDPAALPVQSTTTCSGRSIRRVSSLVAPSPLSVAIRSVSRLQLRSPVRPRAIYRGRQLQGGVGAPGRYVGRLKVLAGERFRRRCDNGHKDRTGSGRTAAVAAIARRSQVRTAHTIRSCVRRRVNGGSRDWCIGPRAGRRYRNGGSSQQTNR